MYDEYGAVYIPSGQGRIRFSKRETWQIVLAVAVLTFAFFNIFPWYGAGLDVTLFFLGTAAVAVITGFALHELMHKFVAQRNGAWAEFRIYPTGLLFAVLFSFFGFVFAAPGAVYIQGRIDQRQNALISAAGPLTNLAIGSVGVLLGTATFSSSLTVGAALYVIGYINAFLALFNLLPIPPLDGSKIWRWNLPLYLA
ncbi:MAG: site-2 protease family protein, partial [Methanomassiliicoccales archaeon]|nr:site-2 protease family protein [Methanomassiliicoccales archaeon]